MKSLLKNRLVRDQGGFTLVELLVTMVMMTIVMFALYSIFDTGIRVFSFGNDKVNVAENARIGLEKMEREIRAAYPYDKAGVSGSVNNTVIASDLTKPNIITFGNDLNQNRMIDTGTNEVITYRLSCTGPPYMLQRINAAAYQCGSGGSGNYGDPVVENVKPGGLEFHYYSQTGLNGTGCPKKDSTGNLIPEATSEPDVKMVCIKLTVEIDRGSMGKRTQTLTTDVALRNRTG